MEPLTIVGASLSVAKLCYTVGWELKKFIDGTKLVGTAINALFQDIQSFGKILEQMKDVVDDPNVKASALTGYVGSHWRHLQTSLDDAEETLNALKATILCVDKSANLLNSTRKHIRLIGAQDEIAVYQQQIRSYKDTIQVSLQTTILWHQVSAKESSELVLPTLGQLQTTIRGLAIDINSRLAAIEEGMLSNSTSDNSGEIVPEQATQIRTLDNLRNCLKSAASIVCSASTEYGYEIGEERGTVHGSDFEDIFPSQPSDFMLDWIKLREITKVDEASINHSVTTSPEWSRYSTLTDPLVNWDSDEEEEVDIIQALFQQGMSNLNANKVSEAEKDLQNCVNRLSNNKWPEEMFKTLRSLQLDAMSGLVTALKKQQKWDDTQKLLKEKITLAASFHTNENNVRVLNDTLMLSEVLLEKKDITEALLYGRRAYRAFKKQDPQNQDRCIDALRILIRICQSSGKQSDADAYLALLRQKFSLNTEETGHALSQHDSHTPNVQPQARVSSRQEQRPQSLQVKPFVSQGRQSGFKQRTLKGHRDWVRSVAFSPDGSVIASASDDKTVKLWDVQSGAEQRTLKGHRSWVRAVAFSPDGSVIASASDDYTVILWDAQSGNVQRTLKGHSGRVGAVAFSPDGSVIASASDDKTVKLWDTQSGAEEWTLKGDSRWFRLTNFAEWFGAVAFSPDGSVIASASDDKTVILWDVQSGAEQRTLKGHSSWVGAVAFSPDGSVIASASDCKVVKLWDARSGAKKLTLKGASPPSSSEASASWFGAVAFSPSGSVIASVSDDKTVILWDARSGDVQRILKGHNGWVMAVAFSPDGSVIASASSDKTVKLWNA